MERVMPAPQSSQSGHGWEYRKKNRRCRTIHLLKIKISDHIPPLPESRLKTGRIISSPLQHNVSVFKNKPQKYVYYPGGSPKVGLIYVILLKSMI